MSARRWVTCVDGETRRRQGCASWGLHLPWLRKGGLSRRCVHLGEPELVWGEEGWCEYAAGYGRPTAAAIHLRRIGSVCLRRAGDCPSPRCLLVVVGGEARPG